MWFWLQVVAVVCWAGINVLDSLLVQRYRRSPIVFMWNQSYYSMVALAGIVLLGSVRASWMVPLLLVGVVGYVGDLLFFVALKRIDVSVTSIAWVILSVLLSIGGFVWFGESWSSRETAGVLLVFLAIILLSLWQRRVGVGSSLLLLPALALLYTPFYLVQKGALTSGDSILAVTFWSLSGRELCAFVIPLLIAPLRRSVMSAVRAADLQFFVMNGLVIALFFLATVLTSAAFSAGPVSLVAVVGNVQPFFVLLLAGLTIRLVPAFAPKELIDKRSIAIKTACFLLAFLGLAFLAFSQYHP